MQTEQYSRHMLSCHINSQLIYFFSMSRNVIQISCKFNSLVFRLQTLVWNSQLNSVILKAAPTLSHFKTRSAFLNGSIPDRTFSDALIRLFGSCLVFLICAVNLSGSLSSHWIAPTHRLAAAQTQNGESSAAHWKNFVPPRS